MPANQRKKITEIAKRAGNHGFDFRAVDVYALVNGSGNIRLYADLKTIERVLDELDANKEQVKNG